MSFTRTLVLLVVVLAFGAWLQFVEEPKAVQEAKADILLDLDPAQVEALRLDYPDGTSIAVHKEGGTWKMTEPVAYPADGTAVENFLNTIKDTKIERRLKKEEAGPLASYGLDGDKGSQARVQVTLAGGKALPSIVLGIATPVGYQAFARKEGVDEVLVIPLLLQSSAKKDPADLRLKKMFDGVDSTGIAHVTIEEPGQTIELDRKGEYAWTMTSPLADAADTESVRSMLDSMATIDAIAFFDGDKVDRKAFGLDEGATRFTAKKDDGSTIAFTIGKEATDQPAGSYFERASDHQVVKVPDWVVKKFAPTPADLRDKRLLSCRLDDVRSMTWTAGGDSYTISRKDAGQPWSISPENPAETLNQRVVDNALNGLVLARGDLIVADAPDGADLKGFGLDAPVARLDVMGKDGPCARLSAAPVPPSPPKPGTPPPAGGPGYFVKNEGRSAILRASAHEFSRIGMKRSEFVDAVKASPASGAASPASGASSPAAAPKPPGSAPGLADAPAGHD